MSGRRRLILLLFMIHILHRIGYQLYIEDIQQCYQQSEKLIADKVVKLNF